MKRERILPMSDPELEALSTKQLLARLRRLHQCEESLTLSDREHSDASGCIEFKQSAEWIAAHKQLRQVLSRREHVPKGDELVRKRLAKAQRSRTSTRRAGRYVSTRRA
jgi:hypothetical protein